MAEEPPDPGRFAEELRRLRIAAGLTQEALAERARVSPNAVNALENGRRRRPRRDTVAMLAGALGLDPTARDALTATVPGRRSRPPTLQPRPPAPGAGIPPNPVAHFVGRERELAVLRRQLRSGGLVAVHGLGGVGKTQLVARYVHDRRADYPDGVYWLRADREASLVGDLASLAWCISLPEREEREQARQIEAVLRWLRRNGRWLVVLDNLEPDVGDAAAHWLPPGLPGHLVLTSRAAARSSRLRLQPLPPQTAARFLLDRTGQTNGWAAREVAETLGCLPLALEQAAAFVEASGRELGSYAALLRTRLLELMSEGTPEDHPLSLVTTLRCSFDRVERERPAAAGLLHLCAHLAPDDIPIGLLQAHAATLPEPLGEALADDVEVDRTIATLHRYSLLERQGERLRVHRLVQSVVRASLAEEARDRWLGSAVRLLCSAFPRGADEHPERWPLCARLLPHAQVVSELVGARPVEPAALGQLLHRAGGYLTALGRYALARPFYACALAFRERALGPDHPDTAHSLNDMAVSLEKQGDLAAARPMHERALAIRLRVVGPDHPDTVESLNNLGWVLRAQGDLPAARQLLERAAATSRRVHGPDHRITVLIRDNLSWLLQQQGDLAAARPLVESVLATRERVLGPDHPDLAVSLHNLGRLLWRLGDLDSAGPLLGRSLATFERSLGSDHPSTARTLHFLAMVCRDQGRLDAATAHLTRAMLVQTRALGPLHEWTVETTRALDEVMAMLATS